MIPGTLRDLAAIYGKVSPDGTKVTVKYNQKELLTIEIPTSKDVSGIESRLTCVGKEYYLELTWGETVRMLVYGTAFDEDRKLRKTGSPREVTLIRHDMQDLMVPAPPAANPPPDPKDYMPVPDKHAQEMRTVAKHLSYDQLSYLTEGNHNTVFFCEVLEYVNKEAAKKVDPEEMRKLARILETPDNPMIIRPERNYEEAARYILGRMAT